MNCLSDYQIEIPESLIATRPLANRVDSRLLVLTKDAKKPLHKQFSNLIDYLNPGDALVLNDTKVFPARLVGKKPTGGKCEILLARPSEDNWVALISTKGRLCADTSIELVGGESARVLGKIENEPGAWLIHLSCDPIAYAQKHGQIPLPPYMRRKADEEDLARYQTIFAQSEKVGAAAAPTAGLHFDEAFLQAVEHKGVRIVRVTLHVGPGTFLPIRVEDLDQHQMHAEWWSIDGEAAKVLNETKATGKRIVAVGTTVVRTLETASTLTLPSPDQRDRGFAAGSGLTRLFIRPGYQFKAVDALVTNFHLPQTTLMLLVAAAVGKERLLDAYREAVVEKYRFFSYGDACYFELHPHPALSR